MHYTKQSEHHCPFCQQKISDVFINKLNEYFDETYKEQLNCLKRESESVKEIYEKVECSVEGILSSYSDDFVEQLELSKLLYSLKSEVSENIALINEKLKNPSKSISLKFSKTIFDTLNLIVDKANKTISDYNFKIQDIDTTKNKIRNELWNAIVQREHKDRVVIFVDDLDRLVPSKAVELLEVLKLFLDCKQCVFVLAIDY